MKRYLVVYNEGQEMGHDNADSLEELYQMVSDSYKKPFDFSKMRFFDLQAKHNRAITLETLETFKIKGE